MEEFALIEECHTFSRKIEVEAHIKNTLIFAENHTSRFTRHTGQTLGQPCKAMTEKTCLMYQAHQGLKKTLPEVPGD